MAIISYFQTLVPTADIAKIKVTVKLTGFRYIYTYFLICFVL